MEKIVLNILFIYIFYDLFSCWKYKKTILELQSVILGSIIYVST